MHSSVFATLALLRVVAERLVVMQSAIGIGQKQLFASHQSLGAAGRRILVSHQPLGVMRKRCMA